MAKLGNWNAYKNIKKFGNQKKDKSNFTFTLTDFSSDYLEFSGYFICFSNIFEEFTFFGDIASKELLRK